MVVVEMSEKFGNGECVQNVGSRSCWRRVLSSSIRQTINKSNIEHVVFIVATCVIGARIAFS